MILIICKTFCFYNSEFYGSISDWILVLISAITAIFLYKTLNSQINVQRVQNELLQLENQKFAKSIEPNLNFEIKKNKEKIEGNYFDIVSIQITNNNENIVNKIKILHNESDNIKRIMIPKDYLPVPLNYLTPNSEPYLLHFLIIEKPQKTTFINFDIEFENDNNLKYRQTLVCIYENIYNIRILKNKAERI